MRLFLHRSPRQSSANAAAGDLEPPSAGRLRGAKTLISYAAPPQEALPTSTPLDVRDTRGSMLSVIYTASEIFYFTVWLLSIEASCCIQIACLHRWDAYRFELLG